MKNGKSIIFSVILLVFVILNNVIFNNYERNIYYLINIIFWIGFIIIINNFLLTDKSKKNLKKPIIEYVILIGIIYLAIYFLSGVFLSFGNNPYDTSLKGIIYNFTINGIFIILKEYLRYKIINSIDNKNDSVVVSILLIITFTLMDFNLLKFLGNLSNMYVIFQMIFYNLLPLIIKNIVYNYIVKNSDYLPTIIYEFIVEGIYWISPILPNATDIVKSVLSMVFPITLLGCVRYEVLLKSRIKIERKSAKNFNILNYILSSILFIMLMWFGLGVFPYKPIAVATNSMNPKLCVGDIAIVKDSKVDEIEIGDIIRYKLENYSVIHRVVDKYVQDGKTYFITKGDSNDSNDYLPVPEEKMLGKVKLKIKYLGLPSVWINSLDKTVDVKVDTGNNNR